MTKKSSAAITSTEIRTEDGTLAATVDLVVIGGGTQLVTVDGTPEERTHPRREAYHVRLLAPNRFLPDELHEVESYDEAVKLGERYAAKLAEHKDRVEALAEDLKV